MYRIQDTNAFNLLANNVALNASIRGAYFMKSFGMLNVTEERA
jgi:hypothetical protein